MHSTMDLIGIIKEFETLNNLSMVGYLMFLIHVVLPTTGYTGCIKYTNHIPSPMNNNLI